MNGVCSNDRGAPGRTEPALAGGTDDRDGLLLDEPVLVLTCARSGSTLLRMILDAHPDLACPAETNIAKILAQLRTVLETLDRGSGAGSMSGAGARHIRGVADSIYADYLTRRGKRRWCDKSLETTPVGEDFLSLYGKAKFICLYRHAMDMMNSALEASPWGLRGYGFDSYARQSSTNTVAAMAAYWHDHTVRTLEFEEKHQDRCLRVHYEELVTNPGLVADRVFDFLGVSRVPGIAKLALAGLDRPEKQGYGDYKIVGSEEITDGSVGRGIRVPPDNLSPAQVAALNRALTSLGYTPVDRQWQLSAYPPALLALAEADGSVPLSVPPPDEGGESEDGFAGHPDGSSFSALDEEITGRAQRSVDSAPLSDGHSGTCAIVAYSVAPPRAALGWRVDWDLGTVASGAPVNFEELDVDWLLTGEVKTWRSVLRGEENIATLMRVGRLRYIGREMLRQDGEGSAAAGEPGGEWRRAQRIRAATDLLRL
jgi:sulfotransferase family protein